MAGAVYDSGRLPHEVAMEPPEAAWVQRADGERVELVIEPGDTPDEWVARPPDGTGDIMVRPGDRLHTQQYAGQSVRFSRVWSQTGDRLVVEQEDDPESQ